MLKRCANSPSRALEVDAGWEAYVPDHMTLADVDSAEALSRYQAGKRAWKAEQRAATGKD
jgi:hypothetical protein